MLIKKAFVLPEDVLLIPVEELAEDIRRQFEFSSGDFAITRPTSRTRSKIVGADAAQFLNLFRKPTTIIEAVVQYSKIKGSNPEELLEASFPILESLINSGWLVEESMYEPADAQNSLPVGTNFAGWRVMRCVQFLEDTEIYQVKNESGQIAALKLFRPEQALAKKFYRQESKILQRLDGKVNPALIAAGTAQGFEYLILEWIQGVHVTSVAGKLRHSSNTYARTKLLTLCVSVAEAYAHLHQQKILHGDIHPRNILVTDDNSIVILDYGLAIILDSTDKAAKIPRGGIAFFLEPEYAGSRINRHNPPSLTPLAEQYSVAALFYHLFTGSHYIDFSLEKEKQLQQILECSLLPFTRHGIQSWKEVESCLAKALNKNPHQRFPSVDEMAKALAKVMEGETEKKDPVDTNEMPNIAALSHLRSAVLERLELPESFLQENRLSAPVSSVNYGAAGIAYAFYRLACLENNPSMLSLADVWSTIAVQNSESSDAYYSNTLELTHKTVGNTSFYYTAPGTYCVQALISQAMNDLVTTNESVSRFISSTHLDSGFLDISFGDAGILHGCSLLYESAPKNTDISEYGHQVFKTLWDKIDRLGSVAEDKTIRYTGIAHGWAGILYALLGWCSATKTAIPDGLESRLRQLAECAEPEKAKSGLQWARLVPAVAKIKGKDFMPGWCNGSAGFVHLWTKAHQLLRDETYLTLAEKAALNAYDDPDRITNLCCGLVGRSYSLLNLYKYTGESKWLVAARHLAASAAKDMRENEFAMHSLYKGELGIALLASDLSHPDWSCMPIFESEGRHLEKND